ncbi:MAG: hypothetical protein ACLUOI_11655 [Eisenbergiella sp.]
MRREIMTASAFIIPLALLSVLSAVMPQKAFSEEENRYLANRLHDRTFKAIELVDMRHGSIVPSKLWLPRRTRTD